MAILLQTVNLIWSFRTDDNTQAAHTSRGAQLGVNLLPPADGAVSGIHCMPHEHAIACIACEGFCGFTVGTNEFQLSCEMLTKYL